MSGFLFEEISLFAGLEAWEIERIKPIFKERTFPAAVRVIAEGEPGKDMFVLVSGRVRVVKTMLLPGLHPEVLAGRDSSKVLATLTGQSRPFFGEMSLVSDSPRSATVETLEESLFLVTDRDSFFHLAQEHPGLGIKLLTALSARMAEMVRSSNAEVMKLTAALALLIAGRG